MKRRALAISEWKKGFLFVGNHLALDFVNTRLVQGDETRELLPDFDAILRWFHAVNLLSYPRMTRLQKQWAQSPRARGAAENIVNWRERLRAQLLAWEAERPLQPSIVRELNEYLAEHPVRSQLKLSTGSLSFEESFSLETPEDLFGPIAYAAGNLFVEADRERTRKCPKCLLHFLDVSKKGNRRWCSMRLCGNRLKVAAYAARRRRLEWQNAS